MLPKPLQAMLKWSAKQIMEANAAVFSKPFLPSKTLTYAQQFNDRLARVLWLYVAKSWQAVNAPVGIQKFTENTCKTISKLRALPNGEQAFEEWKLRHQFHHALALQDIAARLYASFTPSVPGVCLTEPYLRMGVVIDNGPGKAVTVVRPDASLSLQQLASEKGKCTLLEMEPGFTSGRTCSNVQDWKPMPDTMWKTDNRQRSGANGGRRKRAAKHQHQTASRRRRSRSRRARKT